VARGLFLQHEPLGTPGLIGARAAERGFDVVAVRVDEEAHLPDAADFDLVVTLGSTESVTNTAVPWIARETETLRRAIARDVPVLGICFGGQMLAHALGAAIHPARVPEVGWFEIETTDPDLVPPGPWVQWHYEAFDVPNNAVEIARSPAGPQAFTHGPHLGLQFHPELTAEMMGHWVRAFAGDLGRAVLDGGRLLADTERHAEPAARAARRLFDAFLARARSAGRRR
jgi:GMP synthase-like glutamine amidotransferase